MIKVKKAEINETGKKENSYNRENQWSLRKTVKKKT